MFEDHWYQQHYSPEPSPRPRLHDTLRAQSPAPAASALERTSSTSRKKPLPRKPPPELPKAEVPRRPQSIADLRGHLRREGREGTGQPLVNGHSEAGHLPPRPKSRNDLDELRAARYGRSSRRRALRDVEDELQFAQWYGEIEGQLEDANNEEYRLYQATLDSHLVTCDNLLSTTDATLEILSELHGSFLTVESQTSAFQASCASLLSQQNRLQSLAEALATNLQPFAELEPITRVLNRPGSDFVKTPSFRDMLVRLDRCLEWMNDPAHRSFRDVESYAPKFRQCMTRALQLIRHYFVASVKEVTNEVVGRIKERQMNDTTQSALLYAKFRVNAPLLRELVGEIEKRCAHEEYVSILNECYSCFSGVRQRLVLPIVTKRMNELSVPGTSTSKDLVMFARSAVNFQRSLCLDEFELFYAYFSGERGDGEVYNFLETLCDPLYDYLRPKIIHETNLVKLCELCTLLQTRYMRDLEDPDTDIFDRSQLDFGQLIQGTMQDVQTRIVFLTQSVIEDEIRNFTPKPEDLDYPAKIHHPPSTSGDESGRVTPGTPLPNAPVVVDDAGLFDTETVFFGWYPTLRKCIWLLSKIYRLVNSTVFDDLAHNIVHVTTVSLHLASQRISTQKSPADGHLFLIKHLLLLKEQIVAFDIEFVQPDVNIDFSEVTGTFWQLREQGGLGVFSPNGIFRLMKGAVMPKVVANMFDAKVELDVRLRGVINEFTQAWAARMTRDIQGPSNRLKAVEGSDPAETVRRAVEREVPLLRTKIMEYLDDRRTAETLVGAVQDLVINAYEEYFDETFVRANRRPPNPDMPWDVEMFAAWSNDVFGVGRELLRYGDGADVGSGRDDSRGGSADGNASAAGSV